jgi:hypothetical protein
MSAIDADGLELQDLPNGYWFEIVVGGLDASPLVRGGNYVIPGLAGQIWAPKQAHEWPLTLHGTVHGDGATPEESYSQRMDALLDVFDPTDEPFFITVHPAAVGVGGRVPAGGSASIEVEFLRLVGPPARGDQFRIFDLECRCISNPPGWLIDEGGS